MVNKILRTLVYVQEDENKCKDLLNFIIKQIGCYDNSKIDIPLPYCVDITPIDKQISEDDREKGQVLRSLNSLFESEKRQKKPHLHSLIICNILQYSQFMELTYLHRLDVSVRKQEEMLLLQKKIQHMKTLGSLCITLLTPSQGDVRFTDNLVNSIPTKNLTSLSMKGPDAMKAAADHIQKFTDLQELHIDEMSTDYKEETSNKLISSLKTTHNMKQLSLCVPNLDDSIIREKLNLKLKLQVKKETLTKETLGKAVKALDFVEGLYKLDLSRNNLEDEGESLGQLMTSTATLKVLSVCGCNIQANTVQAMVQTIKKRNVTPNLHTLNMGRHGYYNDNNLQTGGCYLGMLLTLLPDLYKLDVAKCNLTDTDLVRMSGTVPTITFIRTLNLEGTELGYDSKGTASLLSHTTHLHALAVGGHGNMFKIPAPIPALCKAADAGFLKNLLVLDMWNSMLKPESLKNIGQHLQFMNSLQVINLAMIDGVQSNDYQHVYSNLPPSLQHLNVYTDYINLDVYQMLEYQHHLNNLHRLNVRMSDSDIELLQEVLEQHNPNIHVYIRDREPIWSIYVHDKAND